MKLIKNRLFIGCLCIVAAFAIGFLAIPYVTNMLNNKVTVVAAARDITKGERLDQSALKVIELTLGDIPYSSAEYYSTAEILLGTGDKYASTDMKANDIVTVYKASSEIPFKDQPLRELENGQLAVAVTVSSLSGNIGAKIQVGDIVTPLLYDGSRSFIDGRIRYLEVIGIVDSDAKDINSDEKSESGIPSAVIFRTVQEQALALTEYENSSKIHLALVCRGAPEKAEQLLEAQRAALSGN